MKKLFQRVFAMMIAFALTITAMPMAEVRAEETQEILLDCTSLDESGRPVRTSTSVEVPVNVTYGELKAFVDAPLSTENFSFTGWEAYYEDNELVSGGRAVLEATYDKYPVRFVKVYVDENDNVITQRFTNYYSAGTTFAEIFPECTVTPDDMGTQYVFTKWNTSIYHAEEVGMNHTYCEIFADYEEYNIIRLTYDYIKDMGDYGVPVDGDKYLFVEKEIALSGKEDTVFQQYFETNHAPTDHYAALGFIGWEWWNGDNWDAEEQNDNEWALYIPNYSKAQIVLETDIESRVYAGESGQSIPLPTEINGVSVVWECDADGLTYEGEYIVPQDVGGSDEIILRPITKEQQSNEKVEVTVYKGEYTESGRWDISSETIKVSVNATEEDIIASLSLGKDVAGLKFEKWTFIGYADGNAPFVQAVYDKNIVTQYWSYLDEEGEIANESETFIFDKNATYRDALNAIEEPEDVLGCTFVKWQLMDSDNSLDDKIEGSDLSWEAIYDKYPVTIEKIYIDNTGKVNVEESIKVYDAGTTMNSIYKENATVPADALNGTVYWFENGNEYEGTVALYNNWISYLAKYEDKVIVGYFYDYIKDADGYGERILDCMYVALDNAICTSEEKIQEYYLNTIVPELNIKHFSKIKFEEWYINDFNDSTGDGYYNYIYPQAVYDTSEVIILDGWVRNEGYNYIWTVEAGQSFTLPYNFDGYYLDWYDQNDILIKNDVYTVPKDADKGNWFYISAQKSSKIPTKNDATSTIIDESGVLPLGVSISSERIESGTIFENTKKLVDEKIKNIIDMVIFEINLYDKDGIELEQLDGKIKVSVQLPFDILEDETITVLRVGGDELVECEVVSAENNYCAFLTDHFSTYVFVKQKVAPKTGDDTNVLPYISLLVFGAGVYMVGSKKQKFML